MIFRYFRFMTVVHVQSISNDNYEPVEESVLATDPLNWSLTD